jgi:hypothetical protein
LHRSGRRAIGDGRLVGLPFPEEFALWQKGRIPDDIWEVWKDGISENFETAIWRSMWAEVSREFESFEAFMKFMKELLLKAEKAGREKSVVRASSLALCCSGMVPR